MPRVTFLLPDASRFGAQDLGVEVARALGRADRTPPGGPGWRPQLQRHFQLTPNRWPGAALARQRDAGDARGAKWLHADPAYVRPDINGVRFLAYGEALVPTIEDCTALLPALKPVFGDAGFTLDAPTPARWYLRLPLEAKLPEFADPADVLGSDLFDYLPDGDLGRRWRALANEAQVVLHNHAWNARRVAQGKPPINSLWFWGAGILPDFVVGQDARIESDRMWIRALASATEQMDVQPLPAAFVAPDVDTLVDLGAVPDLETLETHWLMPALDALRRGGIQSLVLDGMDGQGFILRKGQRWRLWRRPLHRWTTG